MKKTIIFLLAILMVLNVGSCKKEKLNVNPDVIEEINTNYPGAEIIEEDDGLGVIVDNMTYTSDIELSQSGMMDGIIFDNIDELDDYLTITDNIIIKAKKTGVSKQYLGFDHRTGGLCRYFTQTEIEVMDVYYGDAAVGDKLICTERYAMVNVNGEEMTAVAITDDSPLLDDKEYLLVLGRGDESDLFEGRISYSTVSSMSPIDLAEPTTVTTSLAESQIYEKYVINNDTAIDVDEEIQKIINWKKKFKSQGADVSEELTDAEQKMVERAADKCGRIGTKTEYETK